MKRRGVIIAGVLCACLILNGTPGIAKSIAQRITVTFSNITLIVNGKEIKTSAEPFGYKNNIYAPVATIANALGFHQEWDPKLKAVKIVDVNGKMNDQPSKTVDRPIGNGLHIWSVRNAEQKLILEDRATGKEFPIPVPDELEGASIGQNLVTPALSFTSGSQNDFFVFHYGDGGKTFLQLLHYENGNLSSLADIKVQDTYSDHPVFVTYNEGMNSIFVHSYNKERNQLLHTVEYAWNHDTKSLDKITELKGN